MPGKKSTKKTSASSPKSKKTTAKGSTKSPAARKTKKASKPSKTASSAPQSMKKKPSKRENKASRKSVSPSVSKTSKSSKSVKQTDKSRRSSKLSSAPAPKKKHEGPIGFFIRNIEEFEHSLDFDIPRGLLAALFFTVIAELVRFFNMTINRFYFTHVDYKSTWGDLVSPVAGQVPGSFFLYSALVSFFIGFIFVFFYHMVRVSIHGHAPHKKWVKGLLYGVFLVFVSGIPMMLHNYLFLAAPNMLIVAWFAENVMVYLAGGVVIASIMK